MQTFYPTEMTLVAYEFGHKGHFNVDGMLKDRGINVTEGLTIRLNAEEIEQDNRHAFKTRVTEDNAIHYERIKPENSDNEGLTFKVVFDLKAEWTATY
jgi:hypothetical protein